jgi:hypothetical protein
VSVLLPEEKKFYLTHAQVAQRRQMMDSDGWLFLKWICGHGEAAVERFHRPLFYLLAGDALRLAACLDKYDSELVTQIRTELTRRHINWRTREGIRKLRRQLQRINNRISRSMSKTTTGLDAILWLASRNPDVPCELASESGPDSAIALASKSDPVAQKKMLASVGNIMRTDAYAMYYGERLNAKNPDNWINLDWIQMAGRKKAGDQKTIEARGINSQWTGTHYGIIYADDIVGTESGEASTEDAITWIAAIHGISRSQALGGTRHIFNGTIYGPKDDNAVLVANDEFLSLRVPIWKKDVPSTVANIPVDGTPVLPEWYSVEDIRRIRKETLSSNTVGALGAVSWLQNFELTAHEEGAMQFTVDLIKRSQFVWISNPTTKRREIRRYLFNPDGSPLKNPQLRQTSECLCWRRCGQTDHAFVQYDPLQLPRVMGVDQAIANEGDDWGVVPSCIDPHGVIYSLRGAYDKGYWKMVPAIPMIFNRWGGMSNPVRKVGIEANVWQGMSADWLKRDEAFRALARRIEKVSPGQVAKRVRLYNNVLANMEMGTLLLDPDDSKLVECMLKYNGADPDNQWDDPIDALSISVTLHTSAASTSDRDMERFAFQQQQEWERDHDAATGIDTSTNYVEVMWN